MKSVATVLLLLAAMVSHGTEAGRSSAAPGNASTIATPRTVTLATRRTPDVSYGTLQVPEEYELHAGATNSLMGTLTRKSDGFTIHFDIGTMAGTHISMVNKDKFALFRVHTVGNNAAYTGIERANGSQTVVTTISAGSFPANFWADFTRDEDLQEFTLIVNSYAPKAMVTPSLPPIIGSATEPAGPFDYGEAVDGIELGIQSGSPTYRLNHRINVWVSLRNTSGRVLAAGDPLFKDSAIYITTPGGWAAGFGVSLPKGQAGAVTTLDLGEPLHSMIREPGTYMVRWRIGRPKPGLTESGGLPPWRMESGVVTFTVTE